MTKLARSLGGDPIHALRPKTTQSVAYTATAGTISNAVGSKTTVVRVYCTTDAHIAIGTSPTADTDDMPIAADQPEYFKVNPSDKVSAVQQASGGNLYVTEML